LTVSQGTWAKRLSLAVDLIAEQRYRTFSREIMWP
jgi:hypothetical protein